MISRSCFYNLKFHRLLALRSDIRLTPELAVRMLPTSVRPVRQSAGTHMVHNASCWCQRHAQSSTATCWARQRAGSYASSALRASWPIQTSRSLQSSTACAAKAKKNAESFVKRITKGIVSRQLRPSHATILSDAWWHSHQCTQDTREYSRCTREKDCHMTHIHPIWQVKG